MGNDGFQVVSGDCSSYVNQEDLASFQLNLIDEANALFKDHSRMKVPLETQLRHLYHQAKCNSTTVHQLLRQHQIAQGEHLADRILSREEAMDSQTNFRIFDRLPTKLKISAKDVAARNRYVNLELRLHFLELPIFTPPVPDHLIENVVVTWIDFVHAKDHQRSKFRYRLRLTENAAGAFLDQMAANLKVILKETRAPDAFAAIEQRHPRSCFRFNEDKTLKEDGIDDLSVKDRFVAVIDGDILVEGQRLGFGLAIHEADHIFKTLTDLCHQYASITYEKMLVSSDDSDLLVVGLEVLLHRILPSKENRRLQLSHQVHQLVDIQEAMFDLDLDQDAFPVYFTIQRRDGFQGLPGMGSKTALPVVKAAEAYTVKYFDSAASQAASSSSGTSSIETNGNEDDEERDEIFLRKEPGMGKEILNRIPIRDPIHAAFSRVLRCPVLADNEDPLESRPQCILLFAIAHLSATGRYKYRDQDIADCIQKQDLDTEEAKEFIFVELVELLLAYLDMYVTSNQTTAEDADTLSDQVPKSGRIAAEWIPDSTKPRSVIAGERLRDVTVYDNSPASLRFETSPACPRDNAAGDDYDGPSKKMIHSSIAPTPGSHKDKRGINHPRMMRLGKPVIIPSLTCPALEAAQYSFGKKKKLILNSDRFPKEVKDQEMDIDETDSEKNDGNDDEDQEMEDAQSLQPLSSKAKGKQRRIDNNPTGSSSNVKPNRKRKELETVKVNKDATGHGKKAKSNSNPSTKPQYEVNVNDMNPILNKLAFRNRNYPISKVSHPILKPFISSMELSNQSSLFLVTAAFTSINTTLKRLFAVELRDSEDFRRFGGLMVLVFKDFAAGMYAALKGLETSKPTFDENRPSDLQQDRKASHLLSTAPIDAFNSLVSHWLPDTLLPILRPHSNFLKENVERESSNYRRHLSNAAFSNIEVHLTDVLSASASGIDALSVICPSSTTRRELFKIGKARLSSILLYAPISGTVVDANNDDSDDDDDGDGDGDQAEEEEDESKDADSFQKSSKEIQQEKELRQDQSKRLKAGKKIYQANFHRHSSGRNPLTDPASIQPWLTQVVKAVQEVDELSLQQIDHVRVLSAALHQVNQAFLQTTQLFHASNRFRTLQDLITTSDSDVKALHVGLIRMFPIDQEVFGGSLKRRKTIPDCSTFIVRHRISDGVMQRSLSAPELEIQDVPKSINHLIKALFFSMDLVDFTPPTAEGSRPQKKAKLTLAQRKVQELADEAGPSRSGTRRGGRGGQNTAEPEEVTSAREAVASKEIADKARLDNTVEERWESKLTLARKTQAGWSVRGHLLHDGSLFKESCSPRSILSSNIQDSELILSKLKELKLLQAEADYEPLLAEIKAAQGRIGGRVVKIHEDVITRCRSLSLRYFHLIKDALFPEGGGPQLAEGKRPVKDDHWVPISQEMVRQRGHLFMIHLIFSGGPGLDPSLFHRTFTMTKGYMISSASDLRVVVGRKLGQREGDAPLKFRDFFESLEDSPAKRAFEDCIGRTLTPIDLSLLRSSRIRFTLPPLIIGDPETIGKRMKERKLTPGGTAPLWEVGSVDLAIRYLTAWPGPEAKKKALGLTSGSETDADLASVVTMVYDERKIRGQEIGQDPNARLSNVASSLDGQDWIVRRAQRDQHPSAHTDGGFTQTHTAFCREVTVERQDGSREEMTYTERTSFTHRNFSHLVDRFAERIAGIEREYSPSNSNGSAGAAYQAAVYHTNGRLQRLKGSLRARITQIKDWFLHELWVLCGRPERWAELRPTWTIGAADFSSALRHKGMTLNFFYTLMEWVIPRMEPYVDIRLNEEFLSSRTAPGRLLAEAPDAAEGSKSPFLLGKAAQDGEGVARNSVRWPKTENGDRLTKMVFFEQERWNEGSEEWFTAGCLLPRDHASCLRFRDDTSHMIEHDHHPHTASRAPRVPHLSKVQERRQQEEEQIQREKSPEV